MRVGDIFASDDPAVIEHPDFFLAEPPPELWIRTTPDPAGPVDPLDGLLRESR
jgi:hypothetical protein